MYGILITIAVLAGLFYIGAPLLVYRAMHFSAKPSYKRIEDGELTADDAAFVEEAAAQLRALGFSEIDRLLMNQVPSVTARMFVFGHPAHRDMAMVTLIGAKNVPAKRYVEFSTDFQGSLEGGPGGWQNLCTSNNQPSRGFPDHPDKIGYQIPAAHDIAYLHRLHQGAIRQCGFSGTRRPVPSAANLQRELNDGFEREFERWRMRGLLAFDQPNERYRLTLWGAFRLTWMQLPPFKSIIEGREKRRAQELINAVGQ